MVLFHQAILMLYSFISSAVLACALMQELWYAARMWNPLIFRSSA